MTTNPYVEGRREWADRYCDLAKGKRNWQIATAACLAVIGAQSGMIVWQASQSSVQPFIVQVDDLRQVVQVVPAERAGPVDPRIVHALLADFVRNTRSVISDPVAMKSTLGRAYAYAGPPVQEVLNAHYRDRDPFTRAREETVAVQVSSVLPLSEHSYQVQWSETARALDGRPVGESRWQAILTVAHEAPKSLNPDNPLGLYVTGLSWTEML